jgi:hypothetical protein
MLTAPYSTPCAPAACTASSPVMLPTTAVGSPRSLLPARRAPCCRCRPRRSPPTLLCSAPPSCYTCRPPSRCRRSGSCPCTGGGGELATELEPWRKGRREHHGPAAGRGGSRGARRHRRGSPLAVTPLAAGKRRRGMSCPWPTSADGARNGDPAHQLPLRREGWEREEAHRVDVVPSLVWEWWTAWVRVACPGCAGGRLTARD